MKTILEAVGLIITILLLLWIFGIIDCSCGARRNQNPSITITLVRNPSR